MVDVDIPAGAASTAVLFHPHPDMGGNRFNHVVESLYRALPAAGIGAARFDFTSSDMEVAVVEGRAALDATPAGPLVLVGYSFGSMVASRLLDDRAVGWFLIAPPIDHVDPRIGGDPRPKVLAVPEHDFSPPTRVAAVAATWTATDVRVVPGADHFLAGAMPGVVDQVIDWIRALVEGEH
jgi:alpha/beta superfamily hydrolase